MASIKMAVLGAGSFVFGPSVLSQALAELRLDDLDLVLIDIDAETVGLMARIGERMARENGVRSRVSATTDRRAGLEGAAFVVHTAAPQLSRRFAIDREIAERVAPGEYIGEFGGICGISYTVRQLALLGQISADIRAVCPDAWLFCVANPMPRVAEAAARLGIRSVGFCSASSEVFELLWKIFNGEPEPHPWDRARARWDIRMGGTNHFSWLVGLTERATGRDALPELRRRIEAGATSGNPICEGMIAKAGSLLLPNDHHVIDFLEPDPSHPPCASTSHGTPDERRRRLEMLHAIAEGTRSWADLTSHPSWERTVDLVAALALGRPAEFASLNLPNRGQIPGLPEGAFVETAAAADGSGIRPVRTELPPVPLTLCSRAVAVHQCLVEACLAHRLDGLTAAIEIDPTIRDKPGALRAVRDCLDAHSDIVPRYA